MKKIICTIMCVLSLTSCMKYKTLSKIWDIKSENIYKVDCHFFIASSFSRYTKEEHIDVFFDFINVKYEECEERDDYEEGYSFRVYYKINDVRFCNELYYVDDRLYFEYYDLYLDQNSSVLVPKEKRCYISKNTFNEKDIIYFYNGSLYEWVSKQ